ncbi:MAG TPA: type IV pili methyl-accepting chemotaxis transducer N-terminal domain-containing protein [Agitococcus sp.]|nr:type IV pili methyl-accepting chemotaxis transducer N-terminal domain-containing protein [Agitococcus sp.]HMY28552.1 type IV pili methyl-accepting chemotaxis transducer N-terminal domain-containing protein [Agitococcus sp.]HMY82712.1 type IV pili methyl-accepting chemotaxis transducer N-terminal domain-containing protein [Agitococcus sp.]HNC03110.1 type IV pili methyl-accepting chemotaxis transducer N-terminal domain-containing protein [Agitococcus sp.]HNC86957.1 type IV pili methyl-acceptin
MERQRVSVQEATKQRETSIALFESNLKELKAYAPTPEMNEGLKKVETVWMGYKKRVLQTPSREEALTVIRQSDEVLKLSESVVKMVQEYSKVSSARLVNISGRQRMLSQRIAKLYLTKSWGLTYEGLDQDLTTAINDYENALAELTASPLNTDEIKQGLGKVQGIWKFSKSGFALSNENLYVPTAIANTTENLLKHMQAITKQYEVQMQIAANKSSNNSNNNSSNKT